MPIPYKRKPGLVFTKEPFDHILEKTRVENAAGASQTDVCKKKPYHKICISKVPQRTSEERRRTSEDQTILSHETEKVVVV